MAASSENLDVIGTVSYVSQEAWIFPGTIKQNILFGNSYDKDKFKRVLELSCLNKVREFKKCGNSF